MEREINKWKLKSINWILVYSTNLSSHESGVFLLQNLIIPFQNIVSQSRSLLPTILFSKSSQIQSRLTWIKIYSKIIIPYSYISIDRHLFIILSRSLSLFYTRNLETQSATIILEVQIANQCLYILLAVLFPNAPVR